MALGVELQADLAEVRKSLGVVEGHTQATMNFQSATTNILTNLKDNVEEQREVQKSVVVAVEAVAVPALIEGDEPGSFLSSSDIDAAWFNFVESAFGEELDSPRKGTDIVCSASR